MNLRVFSLGLLGVLLVGPLANTQQERPHETPGRLEIAKYPLQLEPPMGPQARKLDPVKLREEAAELAKLAESVPADVDEITQGKLPKAFSDKLKRIEKLSKHLRSELAF